MAVGNPCRVLRPISDRDKKYYFRDHPIDHAQIAQDLGKTNKHKTNPAGSRNGCLRGDFLYV